MKYKAIITVISLGLAGLAPTLPASADESVRMLVVYLKGNDVAQQKFTEEVDKQFKLLDANCEEVEFGNPEGHEGKKKPKNDKVVYRCPVQINSASLKSALTSFGNALLITTVSYPKFRITIGACPGTCQYRSCPSIPDEVCWEPGARCVNDCDQ